VVAQSWLNLVEMALGFYGVYLYYQDKSKRHTAIFCVFVAQLMTFFKTVLYMLCEVGCGFANTRHNTMGTFLSLYILPSSFWLAFPGAIMVLTARMMHRQLAAAGESAAAVEARNKGD